MKAPLQYFEQTLAGHCAHSQAVGTAYLEIETVGVHSFFCQIDSAKEERGEGG